MDQCAVDELYEAFAVLAGSDPDHCSYPKGYMKRQAVFACNTCVLAGMEPAGVCLACANTCHDGHDICELYTKRNFRCDCGNEKFHGFKCKLHTDKEGQNVKNSYNHNYFGRYCSCDRPYPDEDDQVNEEMIQCIVCEDWFHEKHLEVPAVDCEALMEMICDRCMTRAPFLWTYAAHFAVSPLNKQSLSKEQRNAALMTDENGRCLHTDGPDAHSESQQEEPTAGAAGRPSSPDPVMCRLAQQPSEATKCILNELEAKDAASARTGAVFWPYYWRAKLCTCTDCKRTYVKTGVPFLLDESDTLMAHEEKAKAEALRSEELLLSCISSLTHVQQLEIIYQFIECVSHIRQLSWLLLGSLTHSALHQGSSCCMPIPLDAGSHIADHLIVILIGFPEQSKTSVLHMCSLFHAFMFAQLWTIYCEQAAAVPSNQNQNQNEFSSGAILTGLEFWSRVTPSILQLMAHNKVMVEMVCLHVISLMEALQECNSTIFVKHLSAGFQLRLQAIQNRVNHQCLQNPETGSFPLALRKWLQCTQFKMAQVEIQSSEAASQFYPM